MKFLAYTSKESVTNSSNWGTVSNRNSIHINIMETDKYKPILYRNRNRSYYSCISVLILSSAFRQEWKSNFQ